MERPTIPALSTSVTLDELRTLTIAQQKYDKRLTQIFEEAANLWRDYIDQYGDYELPPLPTAARMGIQVVLSSEALEAIDRIRAGQYSRAIAMYAALRLWLDYERRGMLSAGP